MVILVPKYSTECALHDGINNSVFIFLRKRSLFLGTGHYRHSQIDKKILFKEYLTKN